MRSAPTILLDAAHNPAGMQATLTAVAEAFRFRRLVAVVAVLADKDATGMLELLEPAVDEIVVTQAGSERSLGADELAQAAVALFGADRGTVEPRLDDALEAGVRLAEIATCTSCRARCDARQLYAHRIVRASELWRPLEDVMTLLKMVSGAPSRATVYRWAKEAKADKREVNGVVEYRIAYFLHRQADARAVGRVA